MLNSIDKNKFNTKIVTAEGKQFVILFLTFSTDFADEAYQQILNKCPDGVVSPLTTNYYTNLGFLSWTNVVELQGHCITKK
jgi:hypothetical protein